MFPPTSVSNDAPIVPNMLRDRTVIPRTNPIDRATRYITKLSDLDYETANALLFEVIEYVEPRMKADQAYPPVVWLAVLRAKDNLSNEEAEKKFKANGS